MGRGPIAEHLHSNHISGTSCFRDPAFEAAIIFHAWSNITRIKAVDLKYAPFAGF